MTGVKKGFFSFENKTFLAIFCGVVSLLIYCNTIPNFYNLDDELITENHVLTGNDFVTLKKIFTQPYYKDVAGNKYEYRPVVLLSYFFEFMIFGRNPHVSHFFNVILFSATCVLLFYLLSSLFDSGIKEPTNKKAQEAGVEWLRAIPSSMFISLAITLMFAVHPLHTEVIASIKNRDEILSLLFGLLSWFFALRFVDSKTISFYLLYLLFFAVAIFSKQTSITFAILIPISIIMFRHISFETLVVLILPIQLISAIFSPIYLIYKKVGLFVGQIIVLIFFFFFILRRNQLIKFIRSIYDKIKGFFSLMIAAVKKYIHSFSISISDGIVQLRANYKVLLGTIFTLAVIIGAVSFLSKKKEEVKKVQWNVKDTFHDFNELQVVPALETPAPAVIPIAGRRLDYVELPLLYVDDAMVKAATSLLVLRKYFILMYFPMKLRFYYGFGIVPITDFKNMLVWVSLLIHLALFSLLVYFLISKKHFIAAFGILYYLLSIIPLSNMLTPIAGIMAERLAYTASLGFIIAFSYVLVYPLLYKGERIFGLLTSLVSKYFLILFGVILLVFSVKTVSRNFLWKDHLTLMRHDIKEMNKSARGHHLLASHLATKVSERQQHGHSEIKKLLEEAIVHFKRTIELYPEFPNVWYDLGKVYVMIGDSKNAMEAYSNSIKADSTNAFACFELGSILEQSGKSKEAEEAYKLAIQRDSLYLQAYINLSYLYYKQEKYNESVEVTLTAIKHLPNTYELYVNLGKTYLMLNDTNNALVYLEKAVTINSSDKSMLGMMAELFESIGNVEKAQHYRGLR